LATPATTPTTDSNNNDFGNGHTMGPHKMCYKMQNGFCGFNSNSDVDSDADCDCDSD